MLIEFIGEWNDVIENDIKELKDNIIGYLIEKDYKVYIDYRASDEYTHFRDGLLRRVV